MRKKHFTKLLHEGKYIAEVDIELLYADEGACLRRWRGAGFRHSYELDRYTCESRYSGCFSGFRFTGMTDVFPAKISIFVVTLQSWMFAGMTNAAYFNNIGPWEIPRNRSWHVIEDFT